MIQVERVDYIRVPVTDIEKAKHFYGELFGLPVWDSGVCRAAGLRDPSGSPILLHRRHKPYEQG